MKNTIYLLVTLFLCLTYVSELHAEDFYTTQWNRVDVATKNDLPTTALKHLSSIRQKAAKEGNMPQLCRALFQTLQCQVEISPDSLQSCMEALTLAMESEAQPVQRAVYQNLIGRYKRDAKLLTSSLQRMRLLAEARATDYLPLIIQGKDSRWLYNDDLLSLMMSNIYSLDNDTISKYAREAQALYESMGRHGAALLMMDLYCPYDSIKYPVWRKAVNEEPSLSRITRIIEYLEQTERPTLSIDYSSHDVLMPGDTLLFFATARNITEAELKVGQQSYKFHFDETEPWMIRRDTLKVTFDKPGIYTVQTRGAESTDRTTIHVSGIRPIIFGLPDKRVRVAIVDTRTGEPLSQSRLVLRNASKTAVRTYSPASDGYIYLGQKDLEYKNMQNRRLYAEAGTDTYFPPMDPWNFREGYYYRETDVHEQLLRAFTDRNIYRPGQKVYVSTLSYHRDNDDYRTTTGDSLTFCLNDSRGRQLSSLTATVDDMGGATVCFTLPTVCMPGVFNIQVSSATHKSAHAYTDFRVEEYKRPTIELRTDPLTRSFHLGDTVRIEGTARTYSGIPLSQQTITTDQGQTAMTDETGRFCLLYKLEDKERLYWWSRKINLSLTADNGETAQTSVYIPLAWRPEPTQTDDRLTPFWFRENTSKDGASATLTVGSCHKNITAFVDIVSGQKVVEHKVVTFSDSLTQTLKYKKEWGDGATCYIAFVRNNKLHTASTHVVRPLPDKRLLLHWSTFRSELQPGQTEEWALRVTHPDGSPAHARVMARLYDASLDAFCPNDWGFDLPFSRALSQGHWNSPVFYTSTMAVHAPLKQHTPLKLSAWRPELLSYMNYGRVTKNKLYAKADFAAPMMSATGQANRNLRLKGAQAEAKEESAQATDSDTAAPQPQVRSQFEETAFFLPSLRTDAEGCVGIHFRLPESLTSWNFTALAHDDLLNYGFCRDTIVARKLLMTEVQAPRFLREGDRTRIPVTVTNLSEQKQNCRLTFWADEEAQSLQISLAPGERSTYHFDIKAGHNYVTLKAILTSDSFSDGEERTLPILSNMIEMTRSVPFTMARPGSRTLDLTPLWKELSEASQVRFSIERSTNPAWYVVNALPPLIERQTESAYGWAEKLYAYRMADYIRSFVPALSRQDSLPSSPEESVLSRNPELKNTLLEESPWLLEATYETHRQDRLAELMSPLGLEAQTEEALTQLLKLCEPDGGWSWYKGMPVSEWTTTHICTLLARILNLTPACQQTEQMRNMLDKAMVYLHNEMREHIRQTKAEEKKHKTEYPLSDAHYDYLYLCSLAEEAGCKAAIPLSSRDYLLKKLLKVNKSLSMYGKAGTAVILAHYGHSDRADLMLRSLIEHSVCTEEMGRYFDTERAFSGRGSYKIPTQTFAIEALIHNRTKATHRSTDTWLSELRLWLLQSKRTQMWQTNQNTTDAIYALLTGGPDSLTPDTTGAGYSLSSANELIGTSSLTITNDSPTPLWGAAYAQFLIPMQKVQGAASGLQLSRTLSVRRGEKWEKVDSHTQLSVGDRLRICYTLRAERDMDFVSLKSYRAACMEPTAALSGYDWRQGCYRAVRDQRTDYFFEHLSKGQHELQEEMTIDRSGEFSMGIAQAECVYAPEFRACTEDVGLSVSEQ